jgi:hypothetical protein
MSASNRGSRPCRTHVPGFGCEHARTPSPMSIGLGLQANPFKGVWGRCARGSEGDLPTLDTRFRVLDGGVAADRRRGRGSATTSPAGAAPARTPAKSVTSPTATDPTQRPAIVDRCVASCSVVSSVGTIAPPRVRRRRCAAGEVRRWHPRRGHPGRGLARHPRVGRPSSSTATAAASPHTTAGRGICRLGRRR